MTCSQSIFDPSRLEALRRTALLDSPCEESFDRFTRLATGLLKTPVSLISLIDSDRQFFKSSVGLPEPWASARQAPLSHSICQHVVAAGQTLVINDARQDPAFHDHPAVHDFSIAAYLGCPLLTSTGHALGSFCAIDHHPRQWSLEDRALMSDLAACIMTEIRLRSADSPPPGRPRLKVAMLDAITEGIVGLDEQGRCTFVNRAGATLLGRRSEEIIGTQLPDIIHCCDSRGRHLRREECPLLESFRARRTTRLEHDLFWERQGVPVYARAGIAPVFDGGQFIGAVMVFNDISEMKRHEEELRRAKEVSEHANFAKDQFLAVLSHELRTPLNPVLMAAGSLQADPRLPEPVRQEIQMIQRNIEIEARLIDDLLDVTRISRGKLQLHFQRVDAHELLLQSLQMVQRDLTSKQHQISVELAAEEHHLIADPARLQQVFWNLLKNAVKFTPGGGNVTLATANPPSAPSPPSTIFTTSTPSNPAPAAGSCPLEEPRPTLLVTVRDTGIGIEPDALPRIFNAFEQGEASLTRRFGGLGLGLTISRALVELHGGRITATSPGRNRGAAFTIELPTVPEAPAPGAPAPALPRHIRPLDILLVEDHESTAQVMARLLRTLGHHVYTAASAAEALTLAAQRRFDLVLSDIGLPDQTGWDLMHSLRESYHVPGIALSGFGMEADIQKSRDSGFDLHLTKPVDLFQLQSAITQLFP